MHALVFDKRQVASIALMKPMIGFVERRRPGHVTQDCICPKHFVHSTGCIVSGRQIFEDAAYGIYCFTEFRRRLASTGISDRPRHCPGISLVNGTVSHLRNHLYSSARSTSATNKQRRLIASLLNKR